MPGATAPPPPPLHAAGKVILMTAQTQSAGVEGGSPARFRSKGSGDMAENCSANGTMHSRAGGECGTLMPPVEMPSNLNTLQKEIFLFLVHKESQKTLNIAKGVKKKSCKEVNPDLYAMKKMNVLTHREKGNLWSIKSHNTQGEVRTLTDSDETANSETAITLPSLCSPAISGDNATNISSEEPSTLTPEQNEIFQYVKGSKKPLEAIDIARGLNKNGSKDVNRHLYKMKKMNLLDRNKDSKCWSIRSEPDAGPTIDRAPECQQIVNNIYIFDSEYVQVGVTNTVNIVNNIEKVLPAIADGDESDDRGDAEASDSHPNSQSDLDCTGLALSDGCQLNCTGSRDRMKILGDTDSGIYSADDSFGTVSELQKVQKAVQKVHAACSENSKPCHSTMGNIHIIGKQDEETLPPKTSSPIMARQPLQDLNASNIGNAFERMTLDESFEIIEECGVKDSFHLEDDDLNSEN